MWLPAIRAAGLAPLRPHDLRHTAVALWIAAGANPKEVSVRAGHTSVAFTLDRYGHLFEGHDDELRERLDAMHVLGLQAIPAATVVELPAAPARSLAAPARPTADQATKKARRTYRAWAGLMGVRRQGLEPRTVALRGHCSAN